MDFIKSWSTIVANINRLIREKGWSIQDFADHANKDRASVSKIVSGPQKDMKVSTLLLFAEVLGVSPKQLLSEHNE